MKKKIPGILIAAVKSGSGKTAVTCATLEALKERGWKPRAFKCGPDYIDGMFHRKILGVPSHNLDSFFSEPEQLREIYARSVEENGIAIVEGVMGLFDGLGGIKEEGSAYHVASILKVPILLVIDVHGMGRSVLPLLSGFLQYDKEKRIAGVILNKTSEHFYRKIAPIIEAELSLPVLGFLPKEQEFALESRHLGLKMPEEIENLKQQIQRAAGILEKRIDIDKVIELANCAEDMEVVEVREKHPGAERIGKKNDRIRIGIAYDEAFCFYYEENLKLMERMGAEWIPFSPLRDKILPENLDAILLGGGYPELYAKQLEDNCSMRAAIRGAISDGLPSVAECGGFLYLHETLEDEMGVAYEMCGALSGKCYYTGRLVRFGYICLEEKEPLFLKKGTVVKGHEFHYYDSENNGNGCTARKPVTGRSWSCVHSAGNHFWGFPHLYYPSAPDFAEHFLEEARAYREKRRAYQ